MISKSTVFVAVARPSRARGPPSRRGRRRPPCSRSGRTGTCAPSLLTTTWPISPAAPRPSHSSPSSTMPPPTPVPQNTPSIERNGLRRAELELGLGGDVDVVGERDRRAERRLELLRQRVRALPVGQVARARDGARVVVDDAGRADADRGELARRDPALGQRLAQRADHRERDVGRAAGRRASGWRDEPSTSCALVHHHRLDLGSAEVDAAVPCHCLSSTRWRADPRRPRCPRNHTGGSGRTAPRSTSARRACGGRRRGGRRALVGVGRARRRPSARARTSPGARPATRPRRPRRAARGGRAGRARAARSRGRTATQPRAGGCVARVRIATGAAVPTARRPGGGAARRRAGCAPPHAPCAAQRREPHGVGLAAERAPARRRSREPARKRVERGLVLPHREQRPAAQVGAQRHRPPAAGAEQPPEAQAGRARAAAGGRGPCATMPRARSRAGSASGGRRRRAPVGYVVAAVLGYLLGSIPVALLVARRHGVDLRRDRRRQPGRLERARAARRRGARAPAFLGDGAKGAARRAGRPRARRLVGRVRRRRGRDGRPRVPAVRRLPRRQGGDDVRRRRRSRSPRSPRAICLGAVRRRDRRRARSSGARASACSRSRSSSSPPTRSST